MAAPLDGVQAGHNAPARSSSCDTAKDLKTLRRNRTACMLSEAEVLERLRGIRANEMKFRCSFERVLQDPEQRMVLVRFIHTCCHQWDFYSLKAYAVSMLDRCLDRLQIATSGPLYIAAACCLLAVKTVLDNDSRRDEKVFGYLVHRLWIKMHGQDVGPTPWRPFEENLRKAESEVVQILEFDLLTPNRWTVFKLYHDTSFPVSQDTLLVVRFILDLSSMHPTLVPVPHSIVALSTILFCMAYEGKALPLKDVLRLGECGCGDLLGGLQCLYSVLLELYGLRGTPQAGASHTPLGKQLLDRLRRHTEEQHMEAARRLCHVFHAVFASCEEEIDMYSLAMAQAARAPARSPRPSPRPRAPASTRSPAPAAAGPDQENVEPPSCRRKRARGRGAEAVSGDGSGQDA